MVARDHVVDHVAWMLITLSLSLGTRVLGSRVRCMILESLVIPR